jgi:hypothetical protein
MIVLNYTRAGRMYFMRRDLRAFCLLCLAGACGRTGLEPAAAIATDGPAPSADAGGAGDSRAGGDAACRWGFAPRVTLAVDISLRVNGAADFDGDGRLDLAVDAVAADGSGVVGVMAGRGDGTFAPPLMYAAGTDPSVGAGDFNGDGRPDLVATNYGDQTVGIYLNRGDGTFAPQVTYRSELCGFETAVGDLDGDDIDDLAVAHYCAPEVTSVLLNRGDGTLAPQVEYPTGLESDSVAMGDFDGDGHNDLAVGVFTERERLAQHGGWHHVIANRFLRGRPSAGRNRRRRSRRRSSPRSDRRQRQ